MERPGSKPCCESDGIPGLIPMDNNQGMEYEGDWSIVIYLDFGAMRHRPNIEYFAMCYFQSECSDRVCLQKYGYVCTTVCMCNFRVGFG